MKQLEVNVCLAIKQIREANGILDSQRPELANALVQYLRASQSRDTVALKAATEQLAPHVSSDIRQALNSYAEEHSAEVEEQVGLVTAVFAVSLTEPVSQPEAESELEESA